MLQLVLGRAGYGKTEFVFNKIKSLVASGSEDVILLIPEQFSFVSERRLLQDLGEDKVNSVKSFSFSSLNREINAQYGGNDLPLLTKGARAVMMKRAVESVQDSLQLFNKNITSNSFINSVIRIYDEMKSCRVSVDKLIEASENTDREILSLKLSDIAMIIGSYDALIDGEYYDSESELTRLYKKLCNVRYFKGKTVFIDGFSGFVAQEYKIIEAMLNQADKVYITFCTDSFNNNDKYDLFSYVNSNIDILKDVCKKAGVEILKPVILDENKRPKNNALSLIEKYAFSNIPSEHNADCDSVELYAAKNVSDECNNTADKISKLLRSGYKASDITVICRDLDKYLSELQYSFRKYSIPYFDDERQSISSQPLIMLVNFVLRSIIYSYKSEDIISLLKTGMTELSADRISALENYAYVWNINGSQWKQEFTESPRGFTDKLTENDENQLKLLNESREYIISVLEKFKKRSRQSSCRDISKALYFVIADLKADEQLKKLAMSLDANGKSALADEQGRIWDLLMEILDKLAVTSEDKPITLKEYYKLFHLMIANEDIGAIPAGLDNVQIGSADRIRCDNPRAVFVLGANEGEFPRAIVSTGLLSENDRADLVSNKFKLYAYGEALNAQEKYFAYMALSSARERLFVSYIESSSGPSESSIVRGIQSVFPDITIDTNSDELNIDMLETRDNAFEILASSYNDNNCFISSLKQYFKTQSDYASRVNAVESLIKNEDILINNSALATDLFKKNMYLSASRIEDYFNCSFRYFCKFGLGARPLIKAEMDPMQTGTVIHYVLEQLIKDKGSDGLVALDDREIVISVNAYLDDYLKNRMGDYNKFTPRFKYQFMRLSKMLVTVVMRLRDEFSVSDFKAKAFELTIGDGTKGEEVKSSVFTLDDGGTIEIKGAVDRVDMYEQDGKKYIRVVDYKSGNKEFSLSDILYGLNLQMFIYLFTLAKSNSDYSGISSGVLYMHSARPVMSLARGTGDAEIKKEETKHFKMKGVVLNDAENEIAKHMEHDLEGKYIPVKYSEKSGISGNIVSLEELGAVARKINELIIQMGASLHGGKIMQNPVNGRNHDKTCEYCDYGAVCMNRKEINYREIELVDDAQVLAMLKGGEDDA